MQVALLLNVAARFQEMQRRVVWGLGLGVQGSGCGVWREKGGGWAFLGPPNSGHVVAVLRRVVGGRAWFTPKACTLIAYLATFCIKKKTWVLGDYIVYCYDYYVFIHLPRVLYFSIFHDLTYFSGPGCTSSELASGDVLTTAIGGSGFCGLGFRDLGCKRAIYGHERFLGRS